MPIIMLLEEAEMNGLKRVLFVIGMIILVTQTICDVYHRWFEQRKSALDKFDSAVEKTIKESKSIQELVKEYEIADNKVKEYEKNETNPKIKKSERDDIEPYKSQSKLRRAIEQWEEKSKEIFELRFYWGVGFVLTLVGMLLYIWVGKWIGLTSIIIGFIEMIWWSSPSFYSMYGGEPEYKRLLINKLVLSVITLGTMISLWFFDKAEKNNLK